MTIDNEKREASYEPDFGTLVKRYKFIRRIFWMLLLISFITLGQISDEFSITLFVLTFIAAIISAISPCPFCGETVGIKWYGPMLFGNAFGGWCAHCKHKLFGKALTSKHPQP